MKQEKIEKLLAQAKNHRHAGNFAEVVAILLQIVEAHPEELKYKYLLAATFFEIDSYDDARFYASEIIEKDKNSKEAFELYGLINVKDEKYEDAEADFKHALEIDPHFHSARFNLIKLYDEHIHNDEELIINGYYMLSHRDTDRNLLLPKHKKTIFWDWYLYIYGRVKRALGRQKRYREIIELCEEYIAFLNSPNKKPNPSDLLSVFDDIYTSYYLLNDLDNLDVLKKREEEIFSGLRVNLKEHFIFLEKAAPTLVF
jgi:tetratricopeptide (TPR) repeat protein